MNCITEEARAKINLTLPVLGKRPDGYHELDTIMMSVTLADTVELVPAAGISLAVEGSAPRGPENLMWRAAALFFRETGGGGAAMRLVKRIPSEAGLGGGSADAAAVLRGLNRMTGAGLSPAELASLGASLGADVPFCVVGGCARCGGIGEKLKRLPPWPGLPLLIVRPDISVSTGKAYAELDRRSGAGKNTSDAAEAAIRAGDFPALAAALSNDFEDALFPLEPRLREAAEAVRALGLPALMSGSGSAFFLFIPPAARGKAAAAFRAAHPGWFAAEAETAGGYF